MKLTILFCFTLVIVFSHSVFAESIHSQNTSFSNFTQPTGNANDPKGLWIFLGSNLGLVDIKSSDQAANDTSGHQINLKTLVSIYSSDLPTVYDFGLGFQSNKTSNLSDKYNTRSFFVEGMAKYKFHRHWQAGPLVNLLIGNRNTFTSENQTFASFIGLGAVFEDAINDDWIFRVGARALTDLDVSSRNVTKFLIDVQFGFLPQLKNQSTQEFQPYASSSMEDEVMAYEETLSPSTETQLSENNEEDTTQATENPFDEFPEFKSTPAVSKTVESDLPLRTVPVEPLVKMKLEGIKYEKGRVLPRDEDKIYINKLAEALANNQSLFSKVNVLGHSDDFVSSNATNFNKIISKARSNDVLKRFVKNGLPKDKILKKSFDLNQEITGSHNRKVELEFTGVTDESALKQIINSIQ